MDCISILLADDHPIFLEGIRAVLTMVLSVKIVAHAYCTKQLLHLTKQHHPDLIISDSNMSSENITETITALKQANPDVKILIIAEQESEEYIVNLLGAGIDGYVLKEDTPETLIQAIQAITQGGMWISPKSIKQIVGTLVPSCNSRMPHNNVEILSKREHEVLRLLASGMENCEIADSLCITRRTVQNHVSTVYQKLCVKSRSQAVLYAIKQGLVKY